MEESAMLPPPASPIKGDDPCRMEVAGVAIYSVMLLVCLSGLAGNGAVFWLLGFRICRNPINIYILTMAVADFAFLLLMVPSTLLFLLKGGSCAAVVPPNYLRFLSQLSLFFYNLELCLLTAISIESCCSIPCLLRGRCHFPKCLSNMVSVMVTAITNVATLVESFLCVALKHKGFQPLHISANVLNLLVFAPYLVTASTIFFTKFKCVSQQQKIKRVDIIISLTVLLALPFSLCNFLEQLEYTIVSPQFVFLLTCIYSTTKPFIYFTVGSCRRHRSMGSLRASLQKVFAEPEENIPSCNDATMDTAL